jgi:hypothetical protein
VPFSFKGKDILLISPERWEGLKFSKHHYAITLARDFGCKVFFVQPLGRKYAVSESEYSKLFLVDFPKLPFGLRFFPLWFRNLIFKRTLNRLQNWFNIEYDVVWSFDNSVFYDFRIFKEDSIKILHVVDWHQDYNLQLASQTTNCCITTSQHILNKLLKWNANSHFLQHGYSLGDVEEVPFNTNSVNIKVGYSGNLDLEYIDWQLLKELVESHPDIDFWFAGVYGANSPFNSFLRNPNVKYAGVLNEKELKGFLSKMDVLLLCYNYQKFPLQLSNPHKVMEYLGSGKLIVATWSEEYKEHRECILMSDSYDRFIEIFQEAVENLTQYNSEEFLLKRKNIALENTYSNQIKKIEGLLF